MLLLVSIYEGVPDLARFYVLFCAHAVHSANIAEAFVAPVSYVVFYQPFLNQFVSRRLKYAKGKA